MVDIFSKMAEKEQEKQRKSAETVIFFHHLTDNVVKPCQKHNKDIPNMY